MGNGISLPGGNLDRAYKQLGYKVSQLRKNWEILKNYCDDRGLQPWLSSKAFIEVKLLELEISFLSLVKSDYLYWSLDYDLTALTYELLNIKDSGAFFDLKFEEFEPVEISEVEE